MSGLASQFARSSAALARLRAVRMNTWPELAAGKERLVSESELRGLRDAAAERIERTGDLLTDTQGRPDRIALVNERTELATLVAAADLALREGAL